MHLQLSYADMLKRVDPLRKELKDLEKEAEVTRLKGVEINKVIKELEESIGRLVDACTVACNCTYSTVFYLCMQL